MWFKGIDSSLGEGLVCDSIWEIIGARWSGGWQTQWHFRHPSLSKSSWHSISVSFGNVVQVAAEVPAVVLVRWNGPVRPCTCLVFFTTGLAKIFELSMLHVEVVTPLNFDEPFFNYLYLSGLLKLASAWPIWHQEQIQYSHRAHPHWGRMMYHEGVSYCLHCLHEDIRLCH